MSDGQAGHIIETDEPVAFQDFIKSKPKPPNGSDKSKSTIATKDTQNQDSITKASNLGSAAGNFDFSSYEYREGIEFIRSLNIHIRTIPPTEILPRKTRASPKITLVNR